MRPMGAIDRLDFALSRLAGELAVGNAISCIKLYSSNGDRAYLNRAAVLLDEADKRGTDTRRTRHLLACYNL
ncbi:MAG: hypothetical protein HY512_02975 [Candidatus Aenigmarchaeota archaeon]|nr:hypothetical protein [Candidatus Aenigmarchaeota archaeon]